MYFVCPVRFVFADGGFAGALLDWATRILRTTVEIVRKPKDQKGCDYERSPETSEAMKRWAAINGMVRRLTRGQPATRQARRTYDWTT